VAALAALAFNLVKHFSPGTPAPGVGAVERLAALQFFGLGHSQGNLRRIETVPKLLNQLKAFVRRQVRKVESSSAHGRNIGNERARSNGGAGRLMEVTLFFLTSHVHPLRLRTKSWSTRNFSNSTTPLRLRPNSLNSSRRRPRRPT
jgi:hypothetical protein